MLDIVALEEKLKLKLPIQFREFLLQTNGAETDLNWRFYFEDTINNEFGYDSVWSFYDISEIEKTTKFLTLANIDPSEWSIEDKLEYMEEWGVDSITISGYYEDYHIEELTPIGYTKDYGFNIMIAHKGKDIGKIIMLESSLRNKNGVTTKIYLADSFNKFLLTFSQKVKISPQAKPTILCYN